MKASTIVLTVIVTIIITSTAQAVLVPISQLPDGKLQVGDKEFSDFDVSGIVQGGPPEPTAGTVEVEGVVIGNEYGLRIRVAMSAASDQLINANINFKVETDDPWVIVSAKLWLPTAGATGEGLVTVDELIYDAEYFGNLLADDLSCSRELGDGGINQLATDVLMLGGNPAPMDEIWVRMGVVSRGGFSPEAGTASVTEIYVLYTQIPEPATMLLLGLGSLALFRMRKR